MRELRENCLLLSFLSLLLNGNFNYILKIFNETLYLSSFNFFNFSYVFNENLTLFQIINKFFYYICTNEYTFYLIFSTVWTAYIREVESFTISTINFHIHGSYKSFFSTNYMKAEPSIYVVKIT